MKNKFKDAFNGLKELLKDKSVLLQIGIAAAALSVAYFIIGFDRMEMAVTALLCVIVITLESLNSIIESLVDLVCPEYDPRAGRIKDMAAGTVLIAAIASFIIGSIFVIRHLI